MPYDTIPPPVGSDPNLILNLDLKPFGQNANDYPFWVLVALIAL